MLLERFRTAKGDEIAALRALEARGGLPPVFAEERPDFMALLCPTYPMKRLARCATR